MKKTDLLITAILIAAAAILTSVLATATVRATAAEPSASAPGTIARGKYLVDIMGCHDCHTPWKMGPTGPEMDMTRALSGHPEDLKLPPAPALPPGPWIATAAATMTAWAGPWGVSYTMNLTPDKETGLGDWTLEQFVATMKTGKDRGKGRAVLPPMPYFNLAKLTDEDIASVFAYLQSLPPMKNRVPQPIDPPEGQQ
ncbi:MAG: c-type cytochrome [Acidobacteriota bacterium]|nr:c-type cytochrome [Acidobacteriota bacterium]